MWHRPAPSSSGGNLTSGPAVADANVDADADDLGSLPVWKSGSGRKRTKVELGSAALDALLGCVENRRRRKADNVSGKPDQKPDQPMRALSSGGDIAWDSSNGEAAGNRTRAMFPSRPLCIASVGSAGLLESSRTGGGSERRPLQLGVNPPA